MLKEQKDRAVQMYVDGYLRTTISGALGVSEGELAKILPTHDIEVPAWVPDDMRRSYRAKGRTEGEHEAAAWARKVKSQVREGA